MLPKKADARGLALMTQQKHDLVVIPEDSSDPDSSFLIINDPALINQKVFHNKKGLTI